MRIDLHLNLGEIYNNWRRTNVTNFEYITPELLADYIQKNEITHAVVIYTNKNDIIKLTELQPNVSIYPIQWVQEFENIKEKIDDIAVGIKIHSRRGNAVLYDTPHIHEILKQLPDNFIIYCHTQGPVSLKKIPESILVGKLAQKYKNLRFIMGHAGAYGMKAYKPKNKEGRYYKQFLQLYKTQKHAVQKAVLYSNKVNNLLLDSSIVLGNYYKIKLLIKSKQWCPGSDWPFNKIGSVKRNENVLRKYHKNISTEKIYSRTIEYLNKGGNEK